MGIGRNIKTLRNQRNMTQGELADKLNVTNKAISSWENDRTEPNMGMIEQMCRVFQCTKTELIDDIIPEPPQDNDELMAKIQKLSPEQRKDVFRYIDFILSMAIIYVTCYNSSVVFLFQDFHRISFH